MTNINVEVISTFFTNTPVEEVEIPTVTRNNSDINVAEEFLNIIDELNYRLQYFCVPPPVSCIYNSTEYARHTFEIYVRKYCSTKKPIMYFGMNPGPWGMTQTGVSIKILWLLAMDEMNILLISQSLIGVTARALEIPLYIRTCTIKTQRFGQPY